MGKQTKENLIKKETERLRELFDGVDGNKFSFVEKQIDNLAWYNVSIVEVQKKIDEFGTMLRYDNGGGQSGFRENPDVKVVLNYQKNITAITNQLLSLVPGEKKDSKLSELMKM